MNLQITSKKTKDLTLPEITLMNNSRIKEYGKGSQIDFKKEDSKGEFIFIKDNDKIVAFGMMKPVKIKFQNKAYIILGIGRGMAMIKGKEYGRILNAARIYNLKKSGKTGIAFTDRKNIIFFEKAGFKIEKDGIQKFRYLNPKTKELVSDSGGDMVYYEGKDKFVTKLLKSKQLALTDTDFW